MESRIETYTKLLEAKKKEERVEIVKNFLWELRKVEALNWSENTKFLKDLIENNKKEIENLQFDFSETTGTWNKGVPPSRQTYLYQEVRIFYKDKFVKYKDLRYSPLFSIECGNGNGMVKLWSIILIYIHNGKWEGKGNRVLDIKYVKNMDDKAISQLSNSLDWFQYMI